MVIDANTRLTVAIGKPVPGNLNDCRAYAESGVDKDYSDVHVMTDGGYQGNSAHKRIRARVEHALAHMKS